MCRIVMTELFVFLQLTAHRLVTKEPVLHQVCAHAMQAGWGIPAVKVTSQCFKILQLINCMLFQTSTSAELIMEVVTIPALILRAALPVHATLDLF